MNFYFDTGMLKVRTTHALHNLGKKKLAVGAEQNIDIYSIYYLFKKGHWNISFFSENNQTF